MIVRPRLRQRLAALLTLAACTMLTARAGASWVDPRLQFKTLATPHFVIHFHLGTEALAARLALVAEQAHRDLTTWLPQRHRARTQVVLVDQSDLPNGSATPFPYDVVRIYAAPPIGEDSVGNLDDWLRLVFVHEYTHVLHLDRSAGVFAGLRRVFGRAPYVFPNLYLPLWQIEGLATLEESALTGQGRVPAGDFRELVAAAARTRRRQPLDRVNGGLIRWPSGAAPYAYGAYFHEFLARRFGPDKLAELADRTAGRLPFYSAPAFRKVFGASIGSLWREFQAGMLSQATPAAATDATRVTQHGFLVGGPTWDPGVPGRIVYALRDAHGFPALRSIASDGSHAEEITTRVLGDRSTIGTRALYFDQMELARNVSLFSDLYRLDRNPDGRFPSRAVRLTREARLSEPHLAPDQNRLVCVAVRPGRRALAILNGVGFDSRPVSPDAPRTGPQLEILIDEPETQFTSPRWSPDGRLIAATRRRLHGPSEIVLVDVPTKAVRVAVSAAAARLVSPAWTPDGATLLFAADRDGDTFNLYALDVDSGALHALPRVTGGARSPDVSPDGRAIAYVGHTRDGYDVFTRPLDRSAWEALDGSVFEGARVRLKPDATNRKAPGATTSIPAAGTVYRPWGTLLPRFWTPELAYDDEVLKIGASTFGVDVLARHVYGATVLAPTDGGRPDASVFYVYDRWRPQWFAAASSERAPSKHATRHEQTLDLGVLFPVQKARYAMTWLGSVRGDHQAIACGDAAHMPCGGRARTSTDRHAFRAGWTVSTAKQYGYSISAEDGRVIGLTSEHVREALGADGDADAFTADARRYWGLRGHTVLALRGGAGLANGDARVRQVFSLGGPGPQGSPLAFGSDALRLLRGFHQADVAGRRAALVNVDLRAPLAIIERGHGTWPVFVRTLHGALFADAGHAWDEAFSLGDVKTALGVELSMDAVVGYTAPLTITGGVAWRRDGAGRLGDGVGVYARIGRAF